MKNGAGVLRFRLSHLQFDPAENMGMPTADAKHVFIIREALDISRFQAGAGEQELWLAVKDGYGNEVFLHSSCCRASLGRTAEGGCPHVVFWPATSICL